MMAVGRVRGLHDMQHRVTDEYRRFKAVLFRPPDTRRLGDEARLVEFLQVDLACAAIDWLLHADQCACHVVVQCKGQTRRRMAVKVSRNELHVLFIRRFADLEGPSYGMYALIRGGASRTLWDVVLGRASDAPGRADDILVLLRVVFLEPKAQLEMVRQWLVWPWYFLISIQQRPHVVASSLASRVRSDITRRVVLGQQVRRWLWRTDIAKANTRPVFVLQYTFRLAKGRRGQCTNTR